VTHSFFPAERWRDERMLLGAILALALAVRVWGIDFGLPNEHARPDERHLIGFALTMGGNRLNPGFFNYPSFYLFLLLTCFGVYFALGWLTGRFSSPLDLVAEYSIAPDTLYLIDRVLVAVLGSATVAVVFFIVKRTVSSRAGLWAALFLALSYLHVRDSHFGTVDVPMTFMTTLAMSLIVRAEQGPSLRANLVAGLCVGLAISTKYNAAALLAPLLLGHWLQLEAAASAQRSLLQKWLALSLLAVPVGFVLGTPYAVLDFATFSRDVTYELVDKTRVGPTLDLGPGWQYHARHNLPHGIGLPLLFTSILGLLLWLRRDWRTAALIVSFPLGWYVVVGSSHYIFVRYAVPLAPGLCIFAAFAMERLALWAQQRSREKVRAAGLAVAAIALLALPTSNIVQWNRIVARADTRVLAADWFRANVPHGVSVGLIGPVYTRPDLWPTLDQMQRATATSKAQGRGLRNELRAAHVIKTGVPTYATRSFQLDEWVDPLGPERALAEPPDYVVMAEHPAWHPEPGSVPSLGPEYQEVASFIAFTSEASEAAFDLHDAFYLPYAKFGGVRGPGPNLRVLKRRPSVTPLQTPVRFSAAGDGATPQPSHVEARAPSEPGR
jgi:Dolichyl-phosphate-mannose-protein mannosyltransferase